MSKLVLGGSTYKVLFDPKLDDELVNFIRDVVEDSGTSEEYSIMILKKLKKL